MPAEISPDRLQTAAQVGYKRLDSFRKARMMFIRNYVGQYYGADKGEIGSEALNLIFNAIRVLVPNLAMNFPKHKIRSKFLADKDLAELMSLELSEHDREINIVDKYQQVIIDAIFTLGILKSGIAASDSVYTLDDYDTVDAGSVYTEVVDFDNLIIDPRSKQHMFRDAAFIGDRMCVPRVSLLESGLYNNELVERLPKASGAHDSQKAERLTMSTGGDNEDANMVEYVEIAELWVPEAQAIVTVPGDMKTSLPDYLRVDEYYGPDEGPYTFLALSPPVPGNPLPVPMVGIWNDLHVLANRMAKKIVDQAERQRDIVGYRRSAAADAEELLNATEDEAVPMDDPDGVRVHSLGGQKQSNEVHLAHLQNWFNMMSANSEALAGQRSDADSATEARILAVNASVHLEDMNDKVYRMAATEARKRAWYFHTDPFLQRPLIRRRLLPPVFKPSIAGPVMVEAGQIAEEQVLLTPAARRGDFLNFRFEVAVESMKRKDSNTVFMEMMDFATKIMPAVFSAAQAAAMIGVPFSPQEFLVQMAGERGIDWLDKVFYDPNYQFMQAMLMLQGPQAEDSKGRAAAGAQSNPLAAILQNGQPGQVGGGGISPETRINQDQQAGAIEGQRLLQMGSGTGF